MGKSFKMKKKCVFFDRDGVLNAACVKNSKPYPPESFEKLTFVENAKSLTASLKNAGFLLISITNQPDFSRGLKSLTEINQINNEVKNRLQLDDIFCCLHDNKDNCNCRKPKPGMIYEAAQKWNIDLKRSFLIGDRKSDILAGSSVGLITIFIDYNYAEPKPDNANFVCANLQQAVDFILNGRSSG
jgi:D-glycero-D-manno-heptose 1,7-bisphosphate phosphatase